MKTTHERFDEQFTFEGSGDWIDEDKLDAHKIKAFIDQEKALAVAKERKRIVDEINSIKTPTVGGGIYEKQVSDYRKDIINLITKEQ